MEQQVRPTEPPWLATFAGKTDPPPIDRQMSEILTLVLAVSGRTGEHARPEELVAIHRQLLARFKSHCAFQESLMALCHYPHDLRHRREHQQILAESVEFLAQLAADPSAHFRRVGEKWALWSVVHVLREEEQFGTFLRTWRA
jgi:hemerythrin